LVFYITLPTVMMQSQTQMKLIFNKFSSSLHNPGNFNPFGALYRSPVLQKPHTSMHRRFVNAFMGTTNLKPHGPGQQ